MEIKIIKKQFFKKIGKLKNKKNNFLILKMIQIKMKIIVVRKVNNLKNNKKI